ncbi:hypothetical protein G6F40_016491 [Rhizopus arrhizus]|uniref:Uncharacterized protein n=1 Tax=Rhizopus oryzae TaxID=64495 RepID=A0A9P6WUC6_RHIOR|nr:hypothetical protein G6F40_016491 [Rhizopus arrhizus]KAG1286724.1 hypothetical protein G6F64_014174 [Rhizopus arrhizus]
MCSPLISVAACSSSRSRGATCTANGSAGNCGANNGSMYRLRMCTAAMQSTACTMPAGIQIARVEGTTQRPTSERTTISPEMA